MSIDTEILKSIIIEGQELLSEIIISPRNIHLENMARYVFVGIRQAGKSYMMYHRAQQLLTEGHDLRELLFINFDDERLINFKSDDFDRILKAYSSLFDFKPILFLDEIQNVEGWEHFARRLANQKYLVYITGSNANMLSRDIATILGGRYMERYVAPFSFSEWLRAKGIDVSMDWMYGRQRSQIERNLTDYFFWGGFPELLMFSNKRHWLNELYEKILLGDIIRRNGIRNETALRLTLRRLAENIKNPTSYNRLAGMVKATGYSTTPTSVADYIKFSKDACIIFEIENIASKFVERNTVKKHYFIDNGLLNIFLTDSDTFLLENLCANALYRKSRIDPAYTPYFYNKEVEVDFFLPELNIGIQSCYSLRDSDTLDREVRALVAFHAHHPLQRAEIVTYSEEREIETPTLTIRVIPLAQWLLNLENTLPTR